MAKLSGGRSNSGSSEVAFAAPGTVSSSEILGAKDSGEKIVLSEVAVDDFSADLPSDVPNSRTGVDPADFGKSSEGGGSESALS